MLPVLADRPNKRAASVKLRHSGNSPERSVLRRSAVFQPPDLPKVTGKTQT